MTALTQPQMPRPVATQPIQPAPQPMPMQTAPQPMQPPLHGQPIGQPPAQAMPMQAAPAPMQPIGQPVGQPIGQPQPMQAAPQPVQPPIQQPMPMPMQAPAQPMPMQGAAQHGSVPMMPVGGAMPPMMPAHQGQAGMAGHLPLGQEIDVLSKEGGEKVLPQISVHAFCNRQETAHCMNETTRDWRMKRTNVKIYMGGLTAAIEFYHKENTPSLIIIESGMNGPELFSQLEELASVCDEGTKVVMIGASNDIRLYRQLMDKGVSDYIVPPLHPLNLIRSMGELYSDPDAPFVGRAVAFFGAKGGVGSSTIAHNIAWCLSEKMMQETALIDLDSSWGTTGLDFDYNNSSGLEEALAEPERLDETLLDRIMIRHTQNLSILPTAGSLNLKPVQESAAYEAVVNGVRNICPLSILDMPHMWSEWTTNILSTVDDIVITATPDLANLRNTKNLIEYLKAQRPNDPDPIFILNKTGMTKASEISVKDFAAAVGLEPSLVIGFDPDSFFEVSNEGKMLADIKTAAQTVQGLEYIANRLKTGRFETRMKGVEGPKKKSKLSIGKKAKADKDTNESKSLFSFKKKDKA